MENLQVDLIWYKLQGQLNSSGLTAAHHTLPFTNQARIQRAEPTTDHKLGTD
jgi:hypothetical protein